MSAGLQNRCVDWATRFAFSEVAHLLEACCGQSLLCEDRLWRLCQRAAWQEDQRQEQAIASIHQQSEEALPSPLFVAPTDIYEAEAAEFVTLTQENARIFCDAICVPSQKPTRQRAGQEKQTKEAKRHDPAVFVLPRRDGAEPFFCEGMSEKWSCVSAVSAFLRQEWSGCSLSVVAITEGAKKIRSDLATLFGEGTQETPPFIRC